MQVGLQVCLPSSIPSSIQVVLEQHQWQRLALHKLCLSCALVVGYFAVRHLSLQDNTCDTCLCHVKHTPGGKIIKFYNFYISVWLAIAQLASGQRLASIGQLLVSFQLVILLLVLQQRYVSQRQLAFRQLVVVSALIALHQLAIQMLVLLSSTMVFPLYIVII